MTAIETTSHPCPSATSRHLAQRRLFCLLIASLLSSDGFVAAAHTTAPKVILLLCDHLGDGIPDFLGGAEHGRFYYPKNPRAK